MDESIDYSIKLVAKRTGLTPHLIRAWERRYGALHPRRSENRRRVYREADVLRLALLKRAVDAGHTISSIARLPEETLMELTRQGRPFPEPPPGGSRGTALAYTLKEFLDQGLAAVRAMDEPGLAAVLRSAGVGLSRPTLIGGLLLSIIRQLGELWQAGEIRIAHEHVATRVIRDYLSELIRSEHLPPAAPGLIAATPAGQAHEMGALVAAAVATSHGWRVTYLGAELPAEEIAAVAAAQRSRAVALSLVYPAADAAVRQEIMHLRRYLPESISLLIGGRAAAGFRDTAETAGILYLCEMADLPGALASLG